MGQKKTTIQTGTWSPSWGYSLQASASMAQYPTNQNRSTGTNYWITASAIIPSASVTFVSSSYGLGPVNTTAKVSIPIAHFSRLSASPINDAADIKGFNILAYNGIISTLNGYNEISSSINGTTSSFVVMYVSASKANMGSVVGNDLYVSLGTTQNNSKTNTRPTNSISANASFEAKYPTNKNNWTYTYNGFTTSSKNR